MAKNNKQSANTPDDYKAYLMEVIVALAMSDNKAGMIITDPALVAKRWGISKADSINDVKRAENILSAVKLFISKAVDENWTSSNNIK